MQENTKKIIETFKNSNSKEQSAFLDILSDLLKFIQKVDTNKITKEKIMLDKVLEDTNFIKKVLRSNLVQKEKNKKIRFYNLINWYKKSFKEFTWWKWIGLYLYNKDKTKLIEKINNEYKYIDEWYLSEIYANRWIFIGILETFWYIKEIDINKDWNKFIEILKNNNVINKEFSINDIEKDTKWFLKFTDDNILFLEKNEINDEEFTVVINSLSKFFPWIDIIKDSNDQLQNIESKLYYYNIKELKKINSILLEEYENPTIKYDLKYVTTDKWCNLEYWSKKTEFNKWSKPYIIVWAMFKNQTKNNKSVNLSKLFKLLYWEEYQRSIHKDLISKVENVIKWVNKKIKSINNWKQVLTFKGQVLRKL